MTTTDNTPHGGASPRKKRKSTRLALGIAMAVAAIWSFSRTIGDFSETGPLGENETAGMRLGYDFGTVIGASLFLTVIVWLVLYFAFVKRQDPDRGVRHFVILLATSVIAGLAPVVLAFSLFASSPGPSPDLDQMAIEMQAEAAAEQARLEAERDRIVGAGIIDPARIARPGGIKDARDRLVRLRSLFDGAMESAEARAQAFRSRLVEGETNTRRRAAALKAFDEGFAESRAARERLPKLMDEMCGELEAQIDILERTRGAWVVQNGGIAFYRDRDREAFNAHAERLIELETELQSLRQAVKTIAPSRPGVTRAP